MVWGELFLVTGSFVSGSRGQGDWEGAVCISSGPLGSPHRLGPRDRAARGVNLPPLPGPGKPSYWQPQHHRRAVLCPLQ